VERRTKISSPLQTSSHLPSFYMDVMTGETADTDT